MKDINKLLEKYWEGETTLDEEKYLKEHFASNKSSDNKSQAIFNYFREEKRISYHGKFKSPKNNIFKINFTREFAIAASIVILLGLAFLMRNYVKDTPKSHLVKYEVKDPQKAKEITKNALALLARNYNKGETTLSENIKNINKINIINTLIKNN